MKVKVGQYYILSRPPKELHSHDWYLQDFVKALWMLNERNRTLKMIIKITDDLSSIETGFYTAKLYTYAGLDGLELKVQRTFIEGHCKKLSRAKAEMLISAYAL